MRKSKYVGFVTIGVGVLIIVGAAILPVSPASQRYGPFHVGVRGDNCGPAGLVAVRDGNEECVSAAHKRLLATTAVGLLIVAVGMAMFAGGDESRRSRIVVGRPKVRRRSVFRSLSSRRYRPG